MADVCARTHTRTHAHTQPQSFTLYLSLYRLFPLTADLPVFSYLYQNVQSDWLNKLPSLFLSRILQACLPHRSLISLEIGHPWSSNCSLMINQWYVPSECCGNINERRKLVRLIHVDFLNKNTILWKSSYLTCSDLAFWGKLGLSGRKEKEGIFMDSLEARQGPTCFSVTSCVMNQSNLSDISDLSE